MRSRLSLQSALLCALLLAGGCALQQVAGKIEIIDGCMVRIEGLSNTQADEIAKTWDIDPNCRVEVTTETTE